MKSISKNILYTPDIYTVFCLIMLTLAIIARPAYAANSDYLDELSDEADSTSSVPAQVEREAEYDKNMKNMESLLLSEKPSTFKYYKKLSQKDKNKIFSYYIADNSKQSKRFAHLQKKVMDLYFE